MQNDYDRDFADFLDMMVDQDTPLQQQVKQQQLEQQQQTQHQSPENPQLPAQS